MPVNIYSLPVWESDIVSVAYRNNKLGAAPGTGIVKYPKGIVKDPKTKKH